MSAGTDAVQPCSKFQLGGWRKVAERALAIQVEVTVQYARVLLVVKEIPIFIPDLSESGLALKW